MASDTSKVQDTEKNNLESKTSIGEYDNIEEFMKDGYRTLMEAIKHSNGLPQGSDWNFYNTHEGFVKIIKEESLKILKQINTLLKTSQIEKNIRNRGIQEKTELIVEGNDNILERVANNIDDINGIRKISNAPILLQSVSAELPINGSWNQVNNARFSVTSSLNAQDKSTSKATAIRLLTAKNIIRPQKFFKDKINNSSSIPWEPRIKDKPNSLKPLAIFLEETEKGEEFSHPYEYELDRFNPPVEQLLKEVPEQPKTIEETPLIEISEPEQLNELLNALRESKEFAVDLEHHSYRSFMGITCLMQISTKEKDYIIDTLSLRDQLHVLNEVFTKPTILKVFHGSDSDILWLQRDLSLYVVNMFDTYEAAKLLEYSGLSLAYLIKRFCNYAPNKQFQLADWRIRPLPDELKNYAREDTHYLLYIYQMLKNELLAKANGSDNLLVSVFNKSTQICKKRYFKPMLREDSHMDFYRKCKRLFDNRQLYALRELYRWRDQISREEDESTGYVLPNHMLLQIAEILPREMQGILACCNPIPPLVRSNVLELHQIILTAKAQPLEKPIMKEDTRARGTTKKISKLNLDSMLNCPHDLTNSNEFRDDLPTVLGDKAEYNLPLLANNKFENESVFSSCSVFSTPETSEDEQIVTITDKIQSMRFLSPFERYKLVKPYIQAEENKLAQELLEKNKEPEKESADPNNRTDAERVESIRNLFLTLARKSPIKFNGDELDRPLNQIGGTKRKREESSSIEIPTSSHPVYLPISNETLSSKNPKKRDSSEPPPDISPTKKNKRNKKSTKSNKGENSDTQGISENQRNQEDIDCDIVEQQSVQSYQNENRKNRNKWKNNSNEHVDVTNEQAQQTSRKGKNHRKKEFTPYDYSSVDFRQFQGGAGSVAKPQEYKTNYKFKNKRKGGNRNNNKSSSMGMTSTFKGRGRGRGR